jgi:DNA repair photolyase
MRTFTDLRGQSRPRTDLPLFDAPATVRTFDSPEFRDVTFYEVEAKSILNRVPAASRMPFEWTINVYRGCSHACTYCALGDTPILMADGRTKPLAEVQVGDAIYGTIREGWFRRYAITHVIDHWSTVKPAYQITLEDGTQLITSGDHRFLTDRGWKYVTGLKPGPGQRHYLTTKSNLMGTGGFASPPKGGPEYRRGYLCGMIRGDGHVSSRMYKPPNEVLRRVDVFRLGLTDAEALQRTRTFLAEFGISTHEYVFQRSSTNRKQLNGLVSNGPSNIAAIREAITVPCAPSIEWQKGFLAGIFDAEGSYSGAAVRISNTDRAILGLIASSLAQLGFLFTRRTVERDASRVPITCVRLLGGVREHLRFFHTVDPAITRKRTIEGAAVKHSAPLRVTSIEPLGMDLTLYDMTTGTGDYISNGTISHNCFARPSHKYLNFDAGRDFERRIVVKVNAPEVLRRELRKKSWTGAHVAMGTNTDPYQRCEGRYRLTRGVLEVLRDYANPCSVLTKSPLLLRDLDLFVELAGTAGFSANLSIGTLDEEVWRRSEPGTPHPKARMAAVKQLVAAGIPCGILMAPILPGISDSSEQLRAVVRAAADAGASHLTPLTLHLRPGVKEEFLPWLEQAYPELVPDYQRLYRGSNAPKAVREEIANRVRTEKRRHPAFTSPTTPSTARRLPESPPQGSPPPGSPSRASPSPGSPSRGSPPRDPPAEASEPPTQLSLTLG